MAWSWMCFEHGATVDGIHSEPDVDKVNDQHECTRVPEEAR